MEKYVLDTRETASSQENTAPNVEKKIILAFNMPSSEYSGAKHEEKVETESGKATSLREGLEKMKKEVENMGMAEFSFWIVNTFLLLLIVLKEFFLI